MLHSPLGCPKVAQYTAMCDPGAISESRARPGGPTKKLVKIEPEDPEREYPRLYPVRRPPIRRRAGDLMGAPTVLRAYSSVLPTYPGGCRSSPGAPAYAPRAPDPYPYGSPVPRICLQDLPALHRGLRACLRGPPEDRPRGLRACPGASRNHLRVHDPSLPPLFCCPDRNTLCVHTTAERTPNSQPT
jgi:hypothetical protein